MKLQFQGREIEVRHYYFGRALWAQHHGIVTAGVALDTEAPGYCRVAFAFCAPGDAFQRHSVVCRRRMRDRHNHRVVTDANGKPVVETVMLKGGIDIVNARLGVAPLEGYKETYTSVKYGELPDLVKVVIDTFNGQEPKTVFPQLWRRRRLCLATRRQLALNGAWTRDELAAVETLARPEQVQGGFWRPFAVVYP